MSDYIDYKMDGKVYRLHQCLSDWNPEQGKPKATHTEMTMTGGVGYSVVCRASSMDCDLGGCCMLKHWYRTPEAAVQAWNELAEWQGESAPDSGGDIQQAKLEREMERIDSVDEH